MDIVQSLSKLALFGSAWVLWVLMGLSVLSLAVAADRWWYFRRNERAARANRSALLALLRAADLDKAIHLLGLDASAQGQILARAGGRVEDGPEAFADALDGEVARLRPELERGLNLLGTIGNNAPFLGLFGTVLGVIEAFHHLTLGSDQAMGMVMNGIAEALVATAVGIFVALPAVVAYNVFTKQVALIDNDVAATGKLISALLRSRPLTGAASGVVALRRATADGGDPGVRAQVR